MSVATERQQVYLCSVVLKSEGTDNDITSRIAKVRAAFAQLRPSSYMAVFYSIRIFFVHTSYLCFLGWVLHPIFYFGKHRIKSCLLKISEQWRNDSDLDQDLIIIKKKELKAIYSFKYSKLT